ncbi:MAG: HNH endonuclease [Treponema sp.]|jgi:hypothetical protein|nr:HNH endonuclease [Treponema sp.]
MEEKKKEEWALMKLPQNTNAYTEDDNAVEMVITGGKIIIDKEDIAVMLSYGKRHISIKNYCALNNKRILLHRILMDVPNNLFIDHKNGNTLDNRKCNLRICTQAQNNKNSKSRNKSLKDIYWDEKRKKWRVRIDFSKKRLNIGYYDTAEKAHSAYCKAAKKYHGEFARFK